MKPALILEDMELAIERHTEVCCNEVLEQCREVLCDQMYKWFYNEEVDFMKVEEDYRSDKILELYIEISLALWDDDSYYLKKFNYLWDWDNWEIK